MRGSVLTGPFFIGFGFVPNSLYCQNNHPQKRKEDKLRFVCPPNPRLVGIYDRLVFYEFQRRELAVIR